MKSTLHFLTALALLFAGPAVGQHVAYPFCPTDKPCATVQATINARVAASDNVFPLAPWQNYDLKHVTADWHIDMTNGAIQGRLVFRFKALTNLDAFYLDCSDSLSVDSVFHQGIPVVKFLQNKVLRVNLDQTVSSGATDSVLVYYHGLPQPGGLGGYMVSSHNNDTIVSTLSEPYASRDWWPSKMSLDDKIDSIDIAVRVPLGNRVGANGVLRSIDTLQNEVVYHWHSRHPIATYLVGIAAYPYAEKKHTFVINGDSLHLLDYIYPDSINQVNYDGMMVRLDSVFNIYTELFGPYPFLDEKYGHAQWNRGGGMEHQTMSFVSDFNHDLVVHELAHQWFGDKITCGSWSDVWLNESWATYATGLTFERLFGGYWWRAYREDIHNNALKDSSRSVYCDDTSDVGRIFDSRLSYKKGACVLHSLRYLLGDDAFYAATKAYLQDPNLGYGFARTENLKQHMEQASGQNLDEFFNDWFYGNGYPNVQLYWSQKGNAVACVFTQTSHAHPDDGFVFDMKVPVKFFGPGRDTTIDLNIHRAANTYTLCLPFLVDSVLIDPELHWLLGDKRTARLDYLSETGDVHVYPNPTTGSLTAVSGNSDVVLERIELFDEGGRLVYANDRVNAPAFTPFVADLRGFASGAYFLRVTTNASVQVKRVVKLP